MLSTKFLSLGQAVSDEKNQMWQANRRRTTDDGRQVMAKGHMAFGQAS